jgi:hypothetical protein
MASGRCLYSDDGVRLVSRNGIRSSCNMNRPLCAGLLSQPATQAPWVERSELIPWSSS